MAGRLFEELVRTLARRFPTEEEWLIVESVEDALLALRDKPQRFDPGRGVPLRCYLAMTAEGYLRHRLRKEQARRRRERAAALGEGVLENIPDFRATIALEVAIPNSGTEEAGDETRRELARRVALLGPRERAAVGLLLQGIRSAEAWLPLLDIGHLSPREQGRKITFERVRLIRKLKRPARKC